MKAVAVALLLVGFLGGCASDLAYPGASPRLHTTKLECERAGRTWSHISGDCM